MRCGLFLKFRFTPYYIQESNLIIFCIKPWFYKYLSNLMSVYVYIHVHMYIYMGISTYLFL